jgi:tRNA(adenine34) deaminase
VASQPHVPPDDAVRAGLERDHAFMAIALAEACAAADADEVPVGACLVRDGAVVARAHNRTRERRDPLAHAELLLLADALRADDARTGESRLTGTTLYCTVEPCFMCAGALLHARVDRVVFAVRDPKFGGCVSLGNVLTDARSNHRAILREGVGADEARALLQSFFRSKRKRASETREP